MKTWRLVSGILSIVFFLLVTLQSCAVGLANSIENSGEVSGSAGVLVAVLMLAGGIVSIATRNSLEKRANIALITLFGLAVLIGFSMAGSYTDLNIWAGWCLVNVILAVVTLVKNKK